MTKVKTADLIGPALRYAMAIACNFSVKRQEEGDYKPGEPHWWMAYDERRVTPTRNGLAGYIKPGADGVTSGYDYCPDVDWRLIGPLIDARVTALNKSCDVEWWAHSGNHLGVGATPLIAACRAIVAAKLGDEVDIPEELFTPAAQ